MERQWVFWDGGASTELDATTGSGLPKRPRHIAERFSRSFGVGETSMRRRPLLQLEIKRGRRAVAAGRA